MAVPQLWTLEPQADGSKKLRVRPHYGQARALASSARFIWMLAGSQGGKTSFEPIWMQREVRLRGPGDYLAVTATFPLLKLKLLPEFRRLFEYGLGWAHWKASERSLVFTDAALEMLWGADAEPTRIIFGSGNNPEGLESATAKAAVLDEADQDNFVLESWEAVQRRLALHQGRVLAGTTLYNVGWLKQQVYDPWREGDRDHEVIQFPSIANPSFPRPEFERMRRTLPRWKFKLFCLGEFDKPEGLIYSDFADEYRERGGHKVHPFEIPAHWPRFVGVDFGAVNTALVWLAWDPEGNCLYLYDESLEGGRTSAEHAKAAREKAGGVSVWAWYGGARSEVQQRLDWEAGGVSVQEPPVGDVEAGLDRVIGLFKLRRLFIFDTCRGVLDELGSYRRKMSKVGEITEEIENKRNFHRLDALRYIAQAVVDNERPVVPAMLGVLAGRRG